MMPGEKKKPNKKECANPVREVHSNSLVFNKKHFM